MKTAIAVLLLCMVCCLSGANGPAWVADVSDTNPQRADKIEIYLPVGEYATVLVYNTDAIETVPPDGITAQEYVVHYEHRTVFKDKPEERDIAIPYYLPERKWLEPTGTFAVCLHAEKEGTFVVPIKCNSNIVEISLIVVSAVPKSDCGFGFYTDYGRYPVAYRNQERQYMIHMVQHGCNTFSPYGWCLPWGLDVARQLDTAVEVGLVDPSIPIFALPCGPANVTLPEAKKAGKHVDKWPELIGYGPDEPAADRMVEVKKSVDDWHSAGFKCGTSISGRSALAFGEILDVWAVHMTGVTDIIKAKAKAHNVSFWAYDCSLRGTNAALHRYHTGLWAFKVRPPSLLLWSYLNDKDSMIKEDGTWNALRVCEHALGTPDGPMTTVGLEGFRDGTVDYRVLVELERQIVAHPDKEVSCEAMLWLQSLVDKVDMTFWPDGRGPEYAKYFWDVPDMAIPPVTNFNEIRKTALEYIASIQKG